MVQSLHTPTAPITSIDRYRSVNQSQVKQDTPLPQNIALLYSLQQTTQTSPNSPKRNRNRGIVLSQKGWQKLVEAEVLHDRFGRRYTYEQLSEQSLLDVRTISRLLSCEVKVDKSTMRTFFRAFDLQLGADDYMMPVEDETNEPVTSKSHSIDVAHTITPDLVPLVAEVLQLKQHVIEECDRLLNRLGLDEAAFSNLQRSN
ncbi:MAG: hypothetical protein Kow00121_11960 [Elainellaceae cyanobacterium]